MNSIPSAKECAIHGVTEEIKFFVRLIGIGFHPDTNFTDYVKGNRRMIGKHYASVYNRRLSECFDMCKKYELDIYEITLQVMKPLIDAITQK